MGTHSSIAVQHQDKTISAIYCHYDGYLEGVGSSLLRHHNSQEAAEALVSLGDCSTVDGGVVAYSRDRFELKPKVFRDELDYLNHCARSIDDSGFRYLFKDGAWTVWGEQVTGSPMVPVPLNVAVDEE